MRLQVLLVEDEPADLQQYVRDLPAAFEALGLEVDLHPYEDFEQAIKTASDPSRRFDLIVSDTYRGDVKNRDAQALKMVDDYRAGRFCPLVLYSSGVKPPELQESAFVVWADKGKAGDIERAIREVLETGVPTLARQLYEDINRAAGSYLWGFLEKEWNRLNDPSPLDAGALNRVIRRRAAVQLGDIDPDSGTTGRIERDGPEYYIYPSLDQEHFSLGDVIRHKENQNDFRVILTPHCHLIKQPGQEIPRAERVLTVKTSSAEQVLGQKLVNARNETDQAKRERKLAAWACSPAQTERAPHGRHWYLPGFLDIPHLFCDFLSVESVPHRDLWANFERVATLTPPYAEALQTCFATFYGSVGIPIVRPQSIASLLDTADG